MCGCGHDSESRSRYRRISRQDLVHGLYEKVHSRTERRTGGCGMRLSGHPHQKRPSACHADRLFGPSQQCESVYSRLGDHANTTLFVLGNQVNVFEVGAIYLKLVLATGLKDIHPLDPAIYIHRFASLLEFGEDLENVKRDAANLVAGFRRDWMIEGRRPSGICGASLILAARMNNYRRSVAEVVQVVKIADSTIKKRLEEFQTTPAAQMSVAELRDRWGKHDRKEEAFPSASAPPIFQKHRRVEALQEAASARAARRATSEARSEPAEESGEEEHVMNGGTKRKRGKGHAKSGSARGERSSSALPEATFGSPDRSASAGPGPNTQANALARLGVDGTEDEEEDDNDILHSAVLDEALGQDLQEALADNDVAEALQKIEHAKKEEMQSIQERIAHQPEDDPLKGLDEDELDDYILDPIEAKIKMHTWIDTNMDYLVNLQGELNPIRAGGYHRLTINCCASSARLRKNKLDELAGEAEAENKKVGTLFSSGTETCTDSLGLKAENATRSCWTCRQRCRFYQGFRRTPSL
jgi:hypothetical protein